MSTLKFKQANCKNCYKCIRSCPVSAISFQNEQAQIIDENCILCGKCLLVCPQNAKSVESDIDKVKNFINKREKVYVSLAPSYVSAFDFKNPVQIFNALKILGFTHVEETAIGASRVTEEYAKLVMSHDMKNIISTACPTVNMLIEKYYPELIEFMAPVVSPMIAHAKLLKSNFGNRIRVVFIGPCISKKNECNDLQNEDAVDAVLTFDELNGWLEEENIILSELTENEEDVKGKNDSRIYPVSGGILKSMPKEMRKNYKFISVDGIERCQNVLDSLKNGGLENYFIEMSSCTGSCLGGPAQRHQPGGVLEAREKVLKYVLNTSKSKCIDKYKGIYPNIFKRFFNKQKPLKMPDEETLREILAQVGKYSKDMELNCGACGYSTCREKAIAVYNKRAEPNMCLPFMRERAESMSNLIINTTPNAIFALKKDLSIIECNKSAYKMFNLSNETVSGTSILDILPCEDFMNVISTGKNIENQKFYYESYKLTVEQSAIYNPENQILVVVLKDISKEEKKQQHLHDMQVETVDLAQKVIEKQMRVAQEIASLLGETTAETKIALTKLKNSILSDLGDEV